MKRHFSIFLAIFFSFSISKAQVIINEIFADPEPSISLPTEEFIELYNISEMPISLTNWQISDASRTATISSDFVLESNAYAIICTDENATLFTPYGNVAVVNSLPSLNNSGDELSLTNPEGNLVDFVAYNNTWYNDPLKASGGWTLERKNPQNTCDGATNWAASNSEQGGTPGQSNSIEDFNFQDDSPIAIKSVYLTDTNQLEIILSKTPNRDQIETLSVFTIAPELLIERVELTNSGQSVSLFFAENLNENQIYALQILNLEDCQQQSNISGRFEFGIAATPTMGDILINEILFNPASGGVDFIELINVSDQLFSFNQLSILELDIFTNQVDDFETLENINRYVFPDSLYVLTSNTEVLQTQYSVPNPQNMIEVSIPNYANEEGKIALLNQRLDTLDLLQYQEDWHFEGLNRLDGVSLERLSLSAPTQDKTNWFSASYLAGNATPTAPNSQTETTTQPNGEELILSANIFTPDNDGVDDFLELSFAESANGTTANISVYDARGFLVKTLASNQLIGSFNQLRWTGLNNDHQPIAIGHYFIIAELFDSNGKKKILKEKVVVSRRN